MMTVQIRPVALRAGFLALVILPAIAIPTAAQYGHSRLHGGRRNHFQDMGSNPDFFPYPSMSPERALYPYPSLSPARSSNPPGSYYYPRTGSSMSEAEPNSLRRFPVPHPKPRQGVTITLDAIGGYGPALIPAIDESMDLRPDVEQLRRSLARYKKGDAWVKYLGLVELQSLATDASVTGTRQDSSDFDEVARRFDHIAGEEKFRKVRDLAGFDRVHAKLARLVADQRATARPRPAPLPEPANTP